MPTVIARSHSKLWPMLGLYGLVALVALWLIGPFLWLFISSISEQRDLLARPMPLIPPNPSFANYAKIFGLVEFHAQHQSAQILPSLANSVVVIELAKQNPSKEFDFKFALRRAPAHITIRRGEHDLLRWLDTLIFQSTLNGDLDELHKKWLGGPMQPLPAL